MSGLAWLLAVGATWRLTLLVTSDHLTRPPANWLALKVDADWFDYWSSCNWCASWAAGLAAVGSGLAWSDGWGWQLGAGALTASAVTGWLSSFASPDG